MVAKCKVRTADSRTEGLIPEMKIALILADIEHTCTSNELAVLLSVLLSVLSIYELRENILPDFDRCPKEAPLLSQML